MKLPLTETQRKVLRALRRKSVNRVSKATAAKLAKATHLSKTSVESALRYMAKIYLIDRQGDGRHPAITTIHDKHWYPYRKKDNDIAMF